MDILFNDIFLHHNVDSEAEGAYRIKGIEGKIENSSVDGEKYLSLVHPDSYINMIKEACNSGTYIAEVLLNQNSWKAICQAVGITILASEQNDFAVVRPPGHHAGIERAAGFCMFNNIAIATQRLVDQGKKVFILDIDGHHGDGTQSIFYNSNQVFFASIHQMYTFPFTGFPDEKGDGAGMDHTLNIPLVTGAKDKDFLEAVDKAMGAALNFKPDVVAVSAGFDAYEKDKLLGLKYSMNAFYEVGFRLRRSFENVFAVLEGGYHDDIYPCIKKFVEGVNMGAKPSRIRWNDELSVG